LIIAPIRGKGQKRKGNTSGVEGARDCRREHTPKIRKEFHGVKKGG